MRTWIGHKLLTPSGYGDYNKEDKYPLTFAPDNKVSLQTVMEILRNRYEGTEYSPDETGRKDMRVIGTDTSMSVHIVDMNPNLPPAIAGTTWVCLAPAIYGVFVPLNILCSEPSESYAANQPEGMLYRFESDKYPYYTYKELNTLCLTDYKTYGVPVRAYWHEAEKRMIESMKAEIEKDNELLKTDPAKAQRQMTEFCSKLQEKAFEDGKALPNEVRWAMSANSNTMKMGMNPETDELYTTERVLDPIRVELDVSPYGEAEPAP
jgi:dipeptidase